MMTKLSKSSLFVSLAAALAAGCMGGGYANGNMAGAAAGAQTGLGGNMLNAVEGAVVNTAVQNLAGNVMGGAIGSQLPAADQNFRVQQLNGLMQSGSVNQPQQWVNPQTGSTMSMAPLGQAMLHPQTQQQCQNLQETVTLPNGQTINENRMACMDASGKWNLVQ